MPVRGRHRIERLRPYLDQLLAQPGQLGLELQDPPHALEVEPRRRQFLDVTQALEVVVREAPAAPAGPRRIEQALALVDAQRLRMHPGQLGRHRDHVDRLVVVAV